MLKRFWKNCIQKPFRSFRTRGLTNPETNNNCRDEIEVTDTTSSEGEDQHLQSPTTRNLRRPSNRRALILASSPPPKGLFSSVGAKAGQQMKHGISQFGVKPMEMIQEDFQNGVEAIQDGVKAVDKIGRNGIFGSKGLATIMATTLVAVSCSATMTSLPLAVYTMDDEPLVLMTMTMKHILVLSTYYMFFLVLFKISDRVLPDC